MKKVLLLVAALVMVAFISFGQTPTAAARAKCTATTKAGKPCSRYAAAGSTFCKQHDPAGFKCGAKTLSGKPCSRSVKVSGARCSQHQGK